jgi:hypothetical protein
VNQVPEANNRLKRAINSIAVPEDLAARVRSRIHGSPVNARLKGAVNSVQVPPFLEARIRNQVRTEKPSRRWLPRLAPASIAVAAMLGVGIAYQLGHLRLTVRSQESYIATISTQVTTLMRVGLGDHIHCSVFRKYPQDAPTTDQFLEKLGPRYSGLLPIVRQEIPEAFRMTLAHECRYHGRKFVHLSLMDDSNMLSLVITRKGSGESFNASDAVPALVQAGIPMYQSGVQRFQMTAFETRDYLIYFISDLGKQQNTSLMLALAPRVKDFLAKQEQL